VNYRQLSVTLRTICHMVTPQHEALHRIFRHDGELFARTVRHVLHEDVPTPIKVEILDTDMTETRPHIRRGDSVLLAGVPGRGREAALHHHRRVAVA
jgi:hypothetical protein